MKRLVYIIMIGLILFTISGCNESSSRTGNNSNNVNDVLEAAIKEGNAEELPETTPEVTEAVVETTPEITETLPETTPEITETLTQEPVSDDIDIDLTSLSSTMVYSEVFNMLSTPDLYIGKTVKMDGLFSVYHDEATGINYFACIIQDATACCAQGIEFELAGDPKYPEDYPQIEDEICVTGVFDTYMEGEYKYCTLRNAKFVS